MRSNSGKDESRDNLRDPTLRDRNVSSKAKMAGRSSGLGSNARKTGRRGR